MTKLPWHEADTHYASAEMVGLVRFLAPNRVWLLTAVASVLLWVVAVSCTTTSSAGLTPATTPAAEQSPTPGSVVTPSIRATPGSDNAFAVQLQSREFIPEADLEPGLKLVRSSPAERIHILLQLCEAPDSAARATLEESGIHLLSYIPNNAWFASVPRSLESDDPAIPLIRWIGPILPQDKLATAVLKGQIGTWALRDGNRIALDVSFFDDVILSEGEQVILTYGGEVVSSIPLSNKLTVEISRDATALLAREDSVRWIDVVPPPPTTHPEGG